MPNRWKQLKINRFYGLDLKTNPIDVKDGYSLDCENVFQDQHGVVSKRRGNSIMFTSDETSSIEVDEIGSATLSGTKYYFKFVGGLFKYATSLIGATTTITPSPAISTVNFIWWAVIDDRLFFVDGTNALRFFDGTNIFDSSVYVRPTAILATGGVGAGFDFSYTVQKGFSATYYSSESPISPANTNHGSGQTVTVPGNTGPQTLAVNDLIRVYSHATSIAAASKNVTPTSGSTANGTYGSDEFGGFLRITSTAAGYVIVTDAITEDQPQLYSELGVALNKSAPTALTGLDLHYGRLIAWKDDTVYNAKFDDPHSWPSDSSQSETFQYTVGEGDSEDIQRCISYKESLTVFKKTQIYVFGGIGPDNTGGGAYSFRRLETNGIGCIAPKAVVVFGEQEENILIFLSKQGFYASNGSLPVRVGENIETNIIPLTEAVLSKSYAFYHKREGYFNCFVGASNARIGWILDVRKDGGNTVGWFKLTDLPIKCVLWDNDRYIFGTYSGYCASERISATSPDFSDVQIEYVAAADVDTVANTLTVTLAYTTGEAVVIRTNGTIPAGLAANTTYYVIAVSATLIKLATTLVNATLGTAIDITTQGTGTHSVVGAESIAAFYTTNWLNYKSTSFIKKLGKPSVSFDASARSVSLVASFAYDWDNSFIDATTVAINTAHLWGSGIWGAFVWGSGANAIPKSVAIPRRKVRSIRYKFFNDVAQQDFDLQALDMPFDYIRNRDNFA